MTPKQEQELNEKLKNQQFLPAWMRDFHEQKDVFKSFSQWFREALKNHRAKSDMDCLTDALDGLGWVDIHIFMVDYFLYWMATQGYHLQKWNPKCGTYDIHETIAKRRKQELEDLHALISQRKNKIETP